MFTSVDLVFAMFPLPGIEEGMESGYRSSAPQRVNRSVQNERHLQVHAIHGDFPVLNHGMLFLDPRAFLLTDWLWKVIALCRSHSI